MFIAKCAIATVCLPLLTSGQTSTDMKQVLERLDRLEEQNRALLEEIQSLRRQLAPTAAVAAPAAPSPVEERVAIVERRLDEQNQAKVESDNRLPLRLTGMALFNAYLNGSYNGESQYPTTASLAPGSNVGGGTLRQSIIGLLFQGPNIAGGGKVNGSIYFDAFAGTGTSLNQLLRLRVATVDFAWKNTTFSVSQDKPIMAPREPNSLAQMGVSPLTGAGNLWLWSPQARVEQRFALGEQGGLKAQLGIFQTSESGTGLAGANAEYLSRARPGYEGRFEFWRRFGQGGRIEIAPGFHVSDTHVNGQSAPSRIFTVDWLIRPVARVDFMGTFFNGENTGVVGGLRQGVQVDSKGVVHSVQSLGGFAQLTWRATARLSFNVYGGMQDDRNRDLPAGGIGRNLTYAANVFYRVGSNVLASFEASQVRTLYLGYGYRLNPHYDLAIAYLF